MYLSWTHTCIHIYTYTHVRAYMHIHVYTYVGTCVCIQLWNIDFILGISIFQSFVICS